MKACCRRYSKDLAAVGAGDHRVADPARPCDGWRGVSHAARAARPGPGARAGHPLSDGDAVAPDLWHSDGAYAVFRGGAGHRAARSEEHTSELQSLMRISYAVFCLKKKSTTKQELVYTQTSIFT